MSGFIEELYYGNISPLEGRLSPDEEEKRLIEAICDAEAALTEILEDGQRWRLCEYTDYMTQLKLHREKLCFTTGFRLGVHCMCDALAEEA